MGLPQRLRRKDSGTEAMTPIYENTVRLLLRVAPTVFKSRKFALKGGTAINLFIREMPRLSVDLDLVFIDHTLSRADAFEEITAAVTAMADDFKRQRLECVVRGTGDVDAKIFIRGDEGTLVKVEINHVMRGTITPIVYASLTQAVQDKFKMNVTLPMLSHDEVYASKLVAALDRQHPRDLFDVHQLIVNEGISDETIKIFVAYLTGHNRPVHEVIFGNMIDIEDEYMRNFVGMTVEDVPLQVLLDARDELVRIVHSRLTQDQKDFLVSLTRAEPRWDLLDIPHLKDMPAIRWKLQNLKQLQGSNNAKFNAQIQALEERLANI